MSEVPLRIAILAPPWFAVPPVGYGGIEAVVSLLADGLADAGHDVTLFASGDSRTRAKMVAVYDRAPSEWIGHTSYELRHVVACLVRAGEFDVIHDHTGMMGLTLGGLVSTSVLHTVHGPLDGEPGELYEELCRLVPGSRLISISRNQQRTRPHLPWAANIPNGIDFARYPLETDKDEYLLFLGRMSPAKGCHLAIEVARAAGLPLKIAGKKREPLEDAYFDEYVRPHLGDGIEYLGEVDQDAKVTLLAHARTTLFPIDWEEPFGLVMIESMACGTPVLATRRGAVPEVVEHGVGGFIVDQHREMTALLDAARALDPARVRASAAAHFSAERLVADHVAVYRAAVSELAAT